MKKVLIFSLPLIVGVVGVAGLVWVEGQTIISLSLSNLITESELVMEVDEFSLSFLCAVSGVSLLVLIYSEYYMGETIYSKKFILSMVMFILSMMVLIASGDLFWVMVGWDGLGLTSFSLIIFYQNWKSLNSAMVTLVINRLGDFFLLSSILMCWLCSGSVKSWASPFEEVAFLVILGSMTKSSQVPFSAWLPLAMAAPTPVSSLVHSSTLVTAGVYILIRFNSLIVGSSDLIYMVGCVTVVVAGVSSWGENDLKKIIALSTLSHVGLMFMFVGSESIISAKIHLVVHAFFKSALFMVAGVIIHHFSGLQDVRRLKIWPHDVSMSSVFLWSLLSMVGAPFLSGFYSKEVMMGEVSSMEELGKLVWFLLSVSLTCSYSFRLMSVMMGPPLPPLNPLFGGVSLTNKWVVSLGLMSAVVVGGLSYLMATHESNYLIGEGGAKFCLISFMGLGILLGLVFAKWFSSVPYPMVAVSENMWMMMGMTLLPQKGVLKFSFESMFLIDVKGSLDYLVNKVYWSLKWINETSLPLLVYSPFNLIKLVASFALALMVML